MSMARRFKSQSVKRLIVPDPLLIVQPVAI